MLVQTVIEPQFEPEEFQHCPPEPAKPTWPASAGDVRDYIADLVQWGRDCEADVKGGAAWSAQRRLDLNNQGETP